MSWVLFLFAFCSQVPIPQISTAALCTVSLQSHPCRCCYACKLVRSRRVGWKFLSFIPTTQPPDKSGYLGVVLSAGSGFYRRRFFGRLHPQVQFYRRGPGGPRGAPWAPMGPHGSPWVPWARGADFSGKKHCQKYIGDLTRPWADGPAIF